MVVRRGYNAQSFFLQKYDFFKKICLSKATYGEAICQMSVKNSMVKRKQDRLWAEGADFVKYANCPAKLFGQFIDVRFPGEPSIEYQT